jgi:hypothetical protein
MLEHSAASSVIATRVQAEKYVEAAFGMVARSTELSSIA